MAIRDTLGRLDPDDRELLRLVAWDGFSPKEAAAILASATPPCASARSGRGGGWPTRLTRTACTRAP